MKSKTIILISLAGLFILLAQCEEDSDTPSISKDEARALDKADWPKDYCKDNGWYGDGACDDFCPSPDPDCGSVPDICGGFAGIQCPEGMHCVLNGSYPDASGHCVENTAPNICGGFAGIQCPEGMRCELNGSYPDASGHCVPDEGPDCDELDDWVMDMCVPDDDQEVDFELCLEDTDWGNMIDFGKECCEETPDAYSYCAAF